MSVLGFDELIEMLIENLFGRFQHLYYLLDVLGRDIRFGITDILSMHDHRSPPGRIPNGPYLQVVLGHDEDVYVVCRLAGDFVIHYVFQGLDARWYLIIIDDAGIVVGSGFMLRIDDDV